MGKPKARTLGICSYEHVGIRVSDRQRALDFYAALGFQVELDHTGKSASNALEIVNEHGVRINLICNGSAQPRAYNVLQDDPRKPPGLTHIAFAVKNLEEALDLVCCLDIPVTEGPKELPRRRYFFVRDPDGNVLEINEYR
jgi:catechol 2,3-dioxygenase-like lactoylglutathione lyase family enzyme